MSRLASARVSIGGRTSLVICALGLPGHIFQRSQMGAKGVCPRAHQWVMLGVTVRRSQAACD